MMFARRTSHWASFLCNSLCKRSQLSQGTTFNRKYLTCFCSRKGFPLYFFGLNTFFSFSSLAGTVLIQARDIGKLHEDLEIAVNEHRIRDAWELHEKHMRVEGFLRKTSTCKLIARLVETSDVQWLEKAYSLVSNAFEDHKQTLFDREILMYLSLGLAKCRLPIPASTLLRKLIQMELYPPVTVWSVIIGFLSQDSLGSYIAADLVYEIGYLFQDGRIDSRKKCNRPLMEMKPNALAFNIALAGCLLFGMTKKAESLLDMIPRISLKLDATTLVVMACIYEGNCRREELTKLRRHVEEVHNVNAVQLLQFYNCLLSCHFKFGDLDSAARMIIEMLWNAKRAENSLAVANLISEAHKQGDESPIHCSSTNALCKLPLDEKPPMVLNYETFCHDRKFLMLESVGKELLDGLISKLQKQVELITTERGILRPTEKALVKLVKGFLEAGKAKDLLKFLTKIEEGDCPLSVENSVLTDVINACISLGWLDHAYDLLDEMRLAGIRSDSSLYNFLLEAYYRENRMGEVKSLMRDARRAGVQLDANSYKLSLHSRLLEKDTFGALELFKEMKEAKIHSRGNEEHSKLEHPIEGENASLMSKLLKEIKEGQSMDSGVTEWNNIIHFFCKRRLMSDAEKALKKMRSLGYTPNVQTFHSLVTGYASSWGKYTEVTELWGQMKSIASSNGMKFDAELLDSVLFTFVRGGFFVRANEVVEMIEKGNLFVDKYRYRSLYLKYHKTLYKGKPPKFETETQLRKREAAMAFKKWVGL